MKDEHSELFGYHVATKSSNWIENYSRREEESEKSIYHKTVYPDYFIHIHSFAYYRHKKKLYSQLQFILIKLTVAHCGKQ